MHRPLFTTLSKLLALFLAFALIAAACGGDDDDTSTTPEPAAEEPAEEAPAEEPAEEAPAEEPAEETPAEEEAPAEEAPALTASFRGVSEDTITVGVSMLDFEALKELSLSSEGWGDQELVWQTFIDDLNARGGINGRMVEPVYSFYSPLGTTEAEASCLELTVDTESFAVLGGFVGPAEPANTCITGVNNTVLVGGAITEERLAESTAPWVQAATLRERRLDVFLDLLDADGRLQGTNVGVVGSVELASVADLAPAALEARGVTPVSVLENTVPQGDIQAENDNWQVLAERLRADGAEAVLIIGSGQAAMRNISAAGLDVEMWVLDETALNNPGDATPLETLDGAISITSLSEQERWDHPTMQPCRDLFVAANPDIEFVDPNVAVDGDERWFNSIMNYCQNLTLFEILATAAGPELTHDSFNEAIATVGDISLPGVPFASLAADKFDASDSFRLSVFDAEAGEKGELIALTEIMDGTP